MHGGTLFNELMSRSVWGFFNVFKIIHESNAVSAARAGGSKVYLQMRGKDIRQLKAFYGATTHFVRL